MATATTRAGGTWWYRQHHHCQTRVRAGEHCGRCGQPIDLTLRWPHTNSLSIGHVIALEDGGDPKDLANIRPEHLGCNTGARNRRKGRNPTSEDW